MPVAREIRASAFEKLGRYVTRLHRKPAAKSVHRFRTYSRRVEALVGELGSKLSGNDKKLLKLLARLRKKAGKVRDLDAQIAALRFLKIPQEPRRKSELMRVLLEARAKQEKKLPRAFDGETELELKRRLKRAEKRDKLRLNSDPVEIALRLFADLGRDNGAVTEERLHAYRLAGKRARYVAELAGKAPEAVRVVTELKRMQDAIGDWHDWLQLAETAEDLFGTVQNSALVAALNNVTRAKFRQALAALDEAKLGLLRTPFPAAVADGRKPPSKQSLAA